MAPLLRRLAHHPEIELQVAYCTLRGAEPAIDPDFGATVQWDIPLLDGYKWVEVPNDGSGGQGFWGLRNWGLWRLIRQGHFDSVISYTGYRCASFWIALAGARSINAAVIFGTDASSLVPRDSRAWKAKLKKLGWPWLFRLATQVIVPSTPSKELIQSLGISGERVTLAPYVVDNDWWQAAAMKVNRLEVRRRWGARDETLVILFCGKLQPWKRPGDVLNAFARLGNADAIVLFAGDGGLKDDLLKQAQELGLTKHVRFLGFLNQSELPSIYRSADLMVLPSEYEPFGVVVNEAYCCGCAVAISDQVGAGRDLVSVIDKGMIFPCGDDKAIAAILQGCLTDRSRLEAIALKARQRLEEWSPEKNIQATVEAVSVAVARRRGNSGLVRSEIK